MSILKNFKNIPRSPYGEATDPKCNFFLQICNEVPGRGRARARGAVAPAPLGRSGGLVHRRDRGACRTPLGRPGLAPLHKHSTHISSSFEPKNTTKNPEKKIGVRRREAAKPCRAKSRRALPLPFSSPLSFFLDFWWNFWAQMRREWG